MSQCLCSKVYVFLIFTPIEQHPKSYEIVLTYEAAGQGMSDKQTITDNICRLVGQTSSPRQSSLHYQTL